MQYIYIYCYTYRSAKSLWSVSSVILHWCWWWWFIVDPLPPPLIRWWSTPDDDDDEDNSFEVRVIKRPLSALVVEESLSHPFELWPLNWSLLLLVVAVLERGVPPLVVMLLPQIPLVLLFDECCCCGCWLLCLNDIDKVWLLGEDSLPIPSVEEEFSFISNLLLLDCTLSVQI